MKMHSNLRHIALTLVLTLVTVVALAAAQQMPQGRAMMGGQGEMMGPQYDRSTEVTVTAVIKEVKLMTPGDATGGMQGRGGMQGQGGMGAGRMAGPMGGAHLIVDADGTAMEVMLGPLSFLTQQKYTFEIGDRLTITGVRTKRGETDMIAPRIIKRGDTTMTFRDENGRPLWAGPRQGAAS
jgi:hypothetical protein